MKKALLWYRNDLRSHDHEALSWALAHCSEVAAVYVFDPVKISSLQFGLRRWGPHRLKFVLESVRDLQGALAELGVPLHVCTGAVVHHVPQLVSRLGSTHLLAHKETASEERAEERDLEAALPQGVQVKYFWGHTLFHINDLPFSYTELPPVFTAFRKACEKYSSVRSLISNPASHSGQMPSSQPLPSLEDFGLQAPLADERAALQWKGGQATGQQRLHHYLWESKSLSTYKLTRNEMLGADYSSKFSAWLAQGCLSPRQIYWEVKRYEREVGSNQSTYWLVFELMWRDFFRFTAARYGSRLFTAGGLLGKPLRTQPSQQLFRSWCQGLTGVPLVDANMRELLATGFMSNRGRQNVASYLVKDLKQDWRWGAAWFEQQLIDYDVCSNWGNWAYVAGVGNDPREHRYFNLTTQARRYDPEGSYVRHWLPELRALDAAHIHQPWKLGLEALQKYALHGTPFANPLAKPPGAD